MEQKRTEKKEQNKEQEEKNKEAKALAKTEKQNDKKLQKGQQSLIKEKKEGEQQWLNLDAKIWGWMKQYYGFQDDYIWSRLFVEQEG